MSHWHSLIAIPPVAKLGFWIVLVIRAQTFVLDCSFGETFKGWPSLVTCSSASIGAVEYDSAAVGRVGDSGAERPSPRSG